MPFKATKREKNKLYYAQNVDPIKESAKKRYVSNKEYYIQKSLKHRHHAMSINAPRVKEAMSKGSSNFRNRNPDQSRQTTSKARARNPSKARADSQRTMAKFRARNLQMARSNSRQTMAESRQRNKNIFKNRYWVAKSYKKNLAKSRAVSCASTAKEYLKNLYDSRKRSRLKSSRSYQKRAKDVLKRRTDTYNLAEPKNQKVTSLLKEFQDTFHGKKDVVSKIKEGLEKLSHLELKKSVNASYAACKLAASHLIRLVLQIRRKAVRTLLGIKREVSGLQLDSEADFGECKHSVSREPYFSEAAYYVEPLPGPIAVAANGQCLLPDVKYCEEVSSKTSSENKNVLLSWKCTSRCKPVSVQSMAEVKEMFQHDIPELRQALEECDQCPAAKSYKQVWHYPPKKSSPSDTKVEEDSIEHSQGCDSVTDTYDDDDEVITPIQWAGHPLACHLPHSQCQSKLRLLRNAAVHYPKLEQLHEKVYSAIRANRTIRDIDKALNEKDYESLLSIGKTSFENLFESEEYEQFSEPGNSDVLNTPFRIPHLEAKLVATYSHLIGQYEKLLYDYHIHACICCEQLHKRSQVAMVYFDNFKQNEVWLAIKAYNVLTNPDVGDDPACLCNYCRPKIKVGTMPSRCILNGLESPRLPEELKGLDPFSTQLIQKAKAFQTVVRLGTYLNKVPSHNSLKACKGNLFVLPLPLSKTLETLGKSHQELPKPELYVMVDGVPTKGNVIWRSFIDLNKIKKALAKLKQINWLYGDVQPESVEKSAKDFVIEVANSATSTMIEKVSNKTEYVAGLQAYTLRYLDKPVSSVSDIDQYKMVNIDEYPIKSNQQYIDLLCFPDLYPTGEFGEHHSRELALTSSEFVKSKLQNKDSRYRKKPEYIFFLQNQKMIRELTSGIYNMLKNTRQKDKSVRDLLTRLENNDSVLEGNLTTVLQSVRGSKQYW